MPSKSIINIPWPMRGLVEESPYSAQPEGTTLDCLNVRPFDSIERRMRGGQRTGISRYLASQVNGSNKIQAIGSVVEAFDPNSVIADTLLVTEAFTYSDGDLGVVSSGVWETYDYANSTWFNAASASKDIEVESNAARVIADAAATRRAAGVYQPAVSIGSVYVLTLNFTQASGSAGAEFPYILARVPNSPGSGDREHVRCSLIPTSATNLSLVLSSVSGTTSTTVASDTTVVVADSTSFTAEMRVNGNIFSIYVDGVLSLSGTITVHSDHSRVGFALSTTDGTATPAKATADNFTISTGKLQTVLRTTNLVAVSAGDIYSGNKTDGLSKALGSTHLGIATKVEMQGTFQDMFFADGTATSYRYLDLATDTVKDWSADLTAGSLPVGSVDIQKACSIIQLYRGRIVMTGLQEEPQNWFMSKVGAPFDWDYSPATPTAIDAVAGNNSDAGELGDVITAIAPYNDDVMVMGGADSLWLMQGDPAAGGAIDNISRQIGIVDSQAWAWGSAGEFYFFGSNGMYRLAPGTTSPELISRGKLSKTFSEVDPSVNRVRLVYDRIWQGVHIFISPVEQPTTATSQYFWDERTDSFWKDQYPVEHGPSAVYTYESEVQGHRAVIIGGYDGYLRWFDSAATLDDTTAIVSRIRFSPITPGTVLASGRINDVVIVTDKNGNDVTYKMFTGDTPEEANRAADADTDPKVQRTLLAGRNTPIRQRVAHNTLIPVIEQTAASTNWAYETGAATTEVLNRMHFRRV